ncbi:MAG: carboxypeptidase M32 [Clostridia bacterium]
MEQLKFFRQQVAKIKALEFYSFLEGWDAQTEAPKGCFEQRSKYIGILTDMLYSLSVDPEYVDCVTYLSTCDELDDNTKREVKLVAKNIINMQKLPKDEYIQYVQSLSVIQSKYFECKTANDYLTFAPYLAQIFDWQKKYCKYLATDKLNGYDVLLNDYEEGLTQKEYDGFFNALKTRLIPFVKKVLAKKIDANTEFLYKSYPIDKQREFVEYIRKVMCYDPNHSVIKESEHPFTSGVDSDDVRVTIHYYENNFVSSIFSAIHEMGHATYERQVDPSLIDTLLSGGSSMGVHESQSRFYENIIGRSEIFWQTHFPKLKELFPTQLANVTAQDMFRGVNIASASLIRTEADELTYCLHIMLRYDLEKLLINGELTVDELPKMWNSLVKEYLGIEVTSDKEGLLQDVHWPSGSVGYFPTYALGSAISAQLYHKMRQEIDVDQAIASGNLAVINAYLADKVHKFGKSRNTEEILLYATEEKFNPTYFIDYLIEKYSKIYNI